MKKGLAVLLTMFMAVALLAGCSSNASDASSDAKSEASTEASNGTSAATTEDSDAGAADTSASVAASIEGVDGVPTLEDLANQVTIPDGEEVNIAYLSMDQSIEFLVRVYEAMESEVEKYGSSVTLSVYDGQSVAATQVSQAEDIIAKGEADVVLYKAVDNESSVVIVNKLVEAGIPVVMIDAQSEGIDDANSFIGADDVQAGEMCAQMLGEALGDEGGTVNIIEGLQGHPASEARMQGFKEVIANYPNVTLGSDQAGDWDRQKAMSITEDWITGGSEFDAIFACNDDMALSASLALQAAGMNDKIIVGVDAIAEAYTAISEGTMYGTARIDPVITGTHGINLAVAVAMGMEVEGKYINPYVPVTAENVGEYYEG